MSLFKELFCPDCKRTYNKNEIANMCSCGSLLFAGYDLQQGRNLKKETLERGQNNQWRYRELLPVIDPDSIISLGEGCTPLLELNKLGYDLGIKNLLLKDEGFNPTGSFKDRGASCGISRARELGIETVCMATAGNAGGAWAAYSARAGIEFHVIMPEDALLMNKNESNVRGGNTYTIEGLITDAGAVMGEMARENGWFEVSTFKEPYRIEGKKTIGFEIAQEMNWEMPDVIICPTGGGVAIIGIWKGVQEMVEIGWLSRDNKPRMVAVQSTGCAPVVRAFQEGKEDVDYWNDARTIAGGIRVPRTLGGKWLLKFIRESGGTAVAVSDSEIQEMVERTAKKEGLLLCAEGAAGLAAIPRLMEMGHLSIGERVLVLNTGSGLKNPILLTSESQFMLKSIKN